MAPRRCHGGPETPGPGATIDVETMSGFKTNNPGPESASERPVLTVYNREMHLDVNAGRALAVGETIPVIRGNGPREGERIGSATIAGFEHDGSPQLSVTFFGQ